MSKLSPTTPWSTVLRPTTTMPSSIRRPQGIFLGYTKDGKYIRVITPKNCTPSTYAPEFWEVDDSYMSDREKIAELMGRIAESNEPTNVREYRIEIDVIEKRMGRS